MTQQSSDKQEVFSTDFVSSLSRDQLQQLRLVINNRLENLRSEEILIANQEMKEIASRLGYSDPAELMSDASQIKVPSKNSKKDKSARKIATPKYWNKENKSQTWTGRGKIPIWLTQLMNAKEGSTLEDFLIPAEYIAELKAKLENEAKSNAED